MGATFGVASRAVLTGAVFALEVTGDYLMIVPMLLVLGIAEITAERFLSDRLMTDRLVRRGFRVEFDTETDPFRTAVARQAMNPLPEGGIDPDAPSVDCLAYLRDALALFLATDINQVVVTDDGVAVGVLTRDTMSEVLAKRLAESTPQDPSLRLHGPARQAPQVDNPDPSDEAIDTTKRGAGGHEMSQAQRMPRRRRRAPSSRSSQSLVSSSRNRTGDRPPMRSGRDALPTVVCIPSCRVDVSGRGWRPTAPRTHVRALTMAWSGATINRITIEYHPIWVCAPLTGAGGRQPQAADDDIPG